jgi:hypothetical protein
MASKRDVRRRWRRASHRDDPRQALNAFARLHEVEPGELEPLDKMGQLATLLSDWPVLVRVLTDKADLLLGTRARRVWRRVGEPARHARDRRARSPPTSAR